MPWNFVSPSWFCFSSLENLSFSIATPFWLSNCAILVVSDLTWPYSWFCFSSLENLSFSMATSFWLFNCAILAVFELTWPCFAPVCPPLKTRDRSHCLMVELKEFENYLCNDLCCRSLWKRCLMHGLVMWPYWWFECMEHAVLETLGTRVKSVITSLGEWHLLTRFANKWNWNLRLHTLK